MGFIFDAMNRNGGGEADKPDPPDLRLAEDELPSSVADDGGDADADAAPRPDGPDAPEDAEQGAAVAAPQLVVDAEMQLDERLVMIHAPASIAAEEYRGIRTRLLAKWSDRRHLVHTITSAMPKEGKTITSLNLALTFGEMDERSTVVIEGDLRVPTFQMMTGFDDGPGLIQVLQGKSTIDAALRPFANSNVKVLASGGRTSDDAMQLISSPHLTRTVQALRQRFDHVIIDTPPVLDLADAGILGAHSDDVLLAVRMNRTPRPLVDQAIRTLRSYNAPVAGVVLTDLSHPAHRYRYKYGYRYGYRYGYGYHGHSPQRLRRSA